MALRDIPGFAPILNTLTRPLPQFLVSYFVTTTPYLILSLATLMSYNDFFRATTERPSLLMGQKAPIKSYDFIIVGGGTSGLVIASRLSKNYRVLLLEAGGDPHPLSYVPAFGSSLYSQPQVDWEYKSQPMKNIGLGTTSADECLYYPRSRSLGGSTNVNDMIFMRGSPTDYDAWAVSTGDLRWNYNNVEKYFKTKIEDYHGHWEENDHGRGGPVHIEKAGFSSGVHHWLEAGAEFGMKSNSDPNDKHQSEGLFQLDVMTKKGIRFGTFRAYLEEHLRSNRWSRFFRFPFMRRGRQRQQNDNLVVHRYSVVTHIDIDQGEDEKSNEKRAVGVTYYRHAVKQYAHAEKEIILTAGAINTPKLLLLSGIGPLKELQGAGIEQIVELPVGSNLQDHVSTIIGPFLLNSSESFLATRDLNVQAAAEYASNGAGPFSVTNLISGGGLISTASASPFSPNILLTMIGAGTDAILEKQLVETYSLNRTELTAFLKNSTRQDSNYVVVTLGKPRSRGSVTVGSFDPWHKPRIDLNYFSDPIGLDMRDMVEAVQTVVTLYEKTATYRKLNAHLSPEKYPGCESHEMKSEEYYECLIRTVTVTLSNPCCTAPMGIRGSSKAVLDSQLKVIGVKGLRVADASAMPQITNAQITAPTILIGEVASDLIINDWTSKADG